LVLLALIDPNGTTPHHKRRLHSLHQEKKNLQASSLKVLANPAFSRKGELTSSCRTRLSHKRACPLCRQALSDIESCSNVLIQPEYLGFHRREDRREEEHQSHSGKSSSGHGG
jgi:hypothetical protein